VTISGKFTTQLCLALAKLIKLVLHQKQTNKNDIPPPSAKMLRQHPVPVRSKMLNPSSNRQQQTITVKTCRNKLWSPQYFTGFVISHIQKSDNNSVIKLASDFKHEGIEGLSACMAQCTEN